ncbi:MAG: DUF1801 domain-containing protein [Acidobacteriota bacterium]|nr:DUF1801 domain-containing protein [Acidobacteriota bacterium]
MGAKKKSATTSPETVERQIDGFIDKFDSAMAKRIREVRAALRKRFPTAIEMVYDNYNFFVIGYSPTDKPTDYIVSLAANSKGVGLSFNHGADLPDPHGVLQGSGSQNRFVRLTNGAATLKDPHVAQAIDAAVAIAEALPVQKGHTVVRSISAKQRPRR